MSIIKSVYSDQYEILKAIEILYLKDGIEVDPTYSKGVFYKKGNIAQPKMKFDLYPQTKDTVKASAENLPLKDRSVQSIMFDPPFMAGFTTKNKKGQTRTTGIMGERFHGFRYVTDLWKWYDECLREFSRILANKGILIFKCQDTVSSGKNWFSHCFVMERAIHHGFYPKDMFVLTAKNRIIGKNHKVQRHARKFHSYFWVFEKKSCNVPYDIIDIIKKCEADDKRINSVDI